MINGHDLKIMSGTINVEMIAPSVSAFRLHIIGPNYNYKKKNCYFGAML